VHFVAFVAALAALAQEPQPAPPTVPDSQPSEALRVFLDCGPCDFDYVRTEITFVNYVRDRQTAELVVFVTSLPTGGGGRAFTLAFLGRGRLAGRGDTLSVTVNATQTPTERRQILTQTLRLGLLPYLAGTTAAEHLQVQYTAPAASAAARVAHDPWNYWVFVLSGNGFMSGQSSLDDRSFFGNVSANRVTEQWKIGFSMNGSISRSRFDLDDTTTFITKRKNYSAAMQAVRSIGGRWSVGLVANGFQSSFSNIDLRVRVTPAIEVDLFPYAQATRRQLTIRYGAGFEVSEYAEVTLYGQLNETRPVHTLTAGYIVRQPWGSLSASVNHQQYLHDWSKRNERLNLGASVRLFRGLSLNAGGSYTVVRDQLYLPASGATPEEILARQRVLATDYSYFANFGLSFRFGSVYNNIVNPRFGTQSQGFIE